MVGKKTHEKQIHIIEDKENTKNKGRTFDPQPDLNKSEDVREAERKGGNINVRAHDVQGNEDRRMLRGLNQESVHNKRRSDD
jgi:hypothetical protein